MSSDERVPPVQRACPRCKTEYPFGELCPACYGWKVPSETKAATDAASKEHPEDH